MASRRSNYGIRLFADGGDKVVRTFTEIGEKGTQAFGRVAGSARNADQGLDRASKRIQSISVTLNDWDELMRSMAVGYGIYQSIAPMVGLFANFEDALIAVGKTTNLSGKALASFGDDIQNLSEGLPNTAVELLQIAQSAGQVGINGHANLVKFTETVARLGVSSNLAGEEAVMALARLLEVTKESADQVEVLASVVVALGNNFAVTEREIALTANEVGRAVAMFRVSSAEAAALAATIAALGIQAELGGSAMGRLMRAIDKTVRRGGEDLERLSKLTGESGDTLRRVFAEDSVMAISMFLSGLGRVIERGDNATKTLAEFGLQGEEILKVLPVLAQRSDRLTEALRLQKGEAGKAHALHRESSEALKSLSAEWGKLTNTVKAHVTDMVEKFAPALKRAMKELRYKLGSDDPEFDHRRQWEEKEALLERELALKKKIAGLEKSIAGGPRFGSGSFVGGQLIRAQKELKAVEQSLSKIAQIARTDPLPDAPQKGKRTIACGGGTETAVKRSDAIDKGFLDV
ncbi:phage tail tape measure protein [Magnetococcus sp. PR-3]|uniref:phage tail tape measure protein n=1 Tax=Magnetococcus sp. PR-3 TaxID=3120355 RepID=UPI002FCDF5D8